MPNLRDLQHEDLKFPRDDWWLPVVLIDPDKVVHNTAKGTTDPLLGDARAESAPFDPDLGGNVLVKKVTITIRILDLDRVPKENETWIVKYPGTLLKEGPLVTAVFTPNHDDVGGDSLGYIKIFPQPK